MQLEKREQEENVSSAEGKRQRVRKWRVIGSISLDPDGPTVDFKERLALPLGNRWLLFGEGVPKQPPGLKIAEVGTTRLKARVLKYLSKIESCPMQLPPRPFPNPDPIVCEAFANDDMYFRVCDLVNFVLRQFPNKDFRQYAILQNPMKPDSRVLDEVREIWLPNGTNGLAADDRPDQMLLRTWDEDGTYDPMPGSLLDILGKRYDIFSQNFDEEKAASGELDLALEWDTLGQDAKNAVGQLAQCLLEDGLTTGILHARNVLWEVQISGTEPSNLKVYISEPVTAIDTNPSMAEVVFALVHERVAYDRRIKAEAALGASSAA